MRIKTGRCIGATGFNVGEARRVQFVDEARAPFDQFDDLGNKDQVRGDFRFRLSH